MSLLITTPTPVLFFFFWRAAAGLKILSIMQYKIDLKVRNHNSLSRQLLIDTVVSCVPSAWTVSLEDAEVFFLVEVFKVRRFTSVDENEHC
jgi:hypothetical protein